MHIVKPAGKDTVDVSKDGKNKVAKFEARLAHHAGNLRRLGERDVTDRNRRP